MNRRRFLATTVSSAFAAEMAGASHGASRSKRPEYYELRRYHLANASQKDLLVNYWESAAIPALKKIGIGPVGLFAEVEESAAPTIYALLPYKTPEESLVAWDRVTSDADYQKAGAEFLNVPATDPAFDRIESSLMVAFDGFPRLQAPDASKPRIFELRTYESQSQKAHLKKVEMFQSGEIDLFKRVGLTAVFFGRTLIGSKLPNLTYMLTFADMDERNRNWGKFGSDPEWKRLSGMPGYADKEIVSHITNIFLTPLKPSEI